MFTSDRADSNDRRTALIYLVISLVLALAGAVYEHFSFGVYSYYMIYAFAVPLAGGALVFSLADRLTGREGRAGHAGREAIVGLAYNLIHSWTYHAAIATLTAGCIIHGILAICGRPNSLTAAYPAAAAALLAVSAAAGLRQNGIICTGR